MSDYEKKDNRGIIFSRPKDQREEVVGDGYVMIDGEEHRALIVKRDLGDQYPGMKIVYIEAAVLWENKNKSKENSPDFWTRFKIWPQWSLSGWLQKTQAGKPIISLAVSQFIDRDSNGDSSRSNANDVIDYTHDDDIPF